MVRRLILTTAIFGMAAGLAGTGADDASADALYLKNGNVVHGQIVRKTDSAITMKLGTLGEMSFNISEIKSIESNTLDYKSLGKIRPATAKDAADPKEPADAGEKAGPLTEEDMVTLDEALAKLKSDSPKNWQPAEDALAKMGPKVFDRLEKELQGSKKSTASAFLMSAMKRVDSKRAVKPIVAQASNDAANEMTRQAAVMLLGELGDKQATDALLARLNDKKYYVRRDAAAALGMVKDQKALSSLVKASDDNDPDVRKAAMGALAQLTKMNFKTEKEWQSWWDKKASVTTQ